MRLMMIDNYDSFTFNLVQLFYEFDLEILVYRHDEIGLEEIAALAPDRICISPGPRDPEHAGISKDVIARFAGRVPILGICLGMQAVNETFGGVTGHAPLPLHGKRCGVFHDGRGLFRGLPSPFQAARYHSLQALSVPDDLRVTARAADGVVMGLEHQRLPVWGVQFHPESFLTEYGYELVGNFVDRWVYSGPPEAAETGRPSDSNGLLDRHPKQNGALP